MSTKWDLFPFRKLQRKKKIAKFSTGEGMRVSSALVVKLCIVREPSSIAAMMMMHELILSDHLLASRCRDRRT